MTFAEMLIAVSVPALAGWAFYSMRRAMRHDAGRRAELKDFAKTKGLAEGVAEKAPGEFDGNTPITWKTIKRAWSRNPAMDAPNKGAAVFTGSNNGFPFVMDEVSIRKWWTNLYDVYLRMAVELPSLPGTLVVFPASGIGRSGRGVGSTPPSSDRGQRTNLTIRFSVAAGERARERGYLTPHRARLLVKLEEALGGVYIYGGKLFVIHRRDTGKQIDLNNLYDALGVCARMLTE